MDTHSFQRTRIILTSWYVGILAIILFAFSLVLYTGEQNNFARIIVRRDFSGQVPRIILPIEREEIQEQMTALRRAFLLNLIGVDGVILLFGGALSYFLSKKTLKPVQETFERQKIFLADVSHEIRTPLAAIQTASEVSLRSKNKTKEDYQKVIAQILSQSKRLTKMANDLLLLSQIESTQQVAFKKVSLSEILQDLVSTFKTTAEEKHITLTTAIEEKVFVRGDAYKLTQLFMIFLDNALKYTKDTGVITITATASPKPTVSITDTGIGMSAKDVKKIFERFYQVDPSRSRGGNGLGLAIAQEIVKVHKAKVSVKSLVDKGSTFTITFS